MRENFVLPPKLAQNVMAASGNNLRRAIMMLQACHSKHNPMTATQTVVKPTWELFTHDIARLIIEEQSPKRMMLVRKKVYELLTNCVPPEVVMKTLCAALVEKLSDDGVGFEVIKAAAEYEHKMQSGNKPVIH